MDGINAVVPVEDFMAQLKAHDLVIMNRGEVTDSSARERVKLNEMAQKTKTPTKFPLQKELLDILKRFLPLHSVYVISIQKEKQQQEIFLSPIATIPQKLVIYTLFIITHKPIFKKLEDIMDHVYNKMQQRCKIYAILYTMSTVKKKLDFGDNFLSRAIFQPPCMYKKDDALSEFINYSCLFDQRIYKRILESWKARMDRAEYLFSIIDNIEYKEDATSRLFIIHNGIEQTCLALLYVFWEYKPQHYSLSYLLHLCGQFSQLPQTIFPKKTYGLHRMYYKLCNAQDTIRFKTQNECSLGDANKAYNRCKRFYEQAKKLGEEQLVYLKELHCKPSE